MTFFTESDGLGWVELGDFYDNAQAIKWFRGMCFAMRKNGCFTRGAPQINLHNQDAKRIAYMLSDQTIREETEAK